MNYSYARLWKLMSKLRCETDITFILDSVWILILWWGSQLAAVDLVEVAGVSALSGRWLSMQIYAAKVSLWMNPYFLITASQNSNRPTYFFITWALIYVYLYLQTWVKCLLKRGKQTKSKKRNDPAGLNRFHFKASMILDHNAEP